MKCGIVRLSELGDRWDAEFHLASLEHRAQAERLKTVMSVADVEQLLLGGTAFSTADLAALKPLSRRSNYFTSEAVAKVVREYPYLAMAIVMATAGPRLAEQRAVLVQKLAEIDAVIERVADAKRSVDQMVAETSPADQPAIAPRVQAIPDDVQPLLATHRYVAGVVYQNGDELIIPVSTEPTSWVSDCWVIPVDEWAGRETLLALVAQGEVPVPRQYQGLGTPIGFVDLPDHTVNYGMGWRR